MWIFSLITVILATAVKKSGLPVTLSEIITDVYALLPSLPWKRSSHLRN